MLWLLISMVNVTIDSKRWCVITSWTVSLLWLLHAVVIKFVDCCQRTELPYAAGITSAELELEKAHEQARLPKLLSNLSKPSIITSKPFLYFRAMHTPSLQFAVLSHDQKCTDSKINTCTPLQGIACVSFPVSAFRPCDRIANCKVVVCMALK